jgi:hypothetical protein
MLSSLGARLAFKAFKEAFVDDLDTIKKLFAQMGIFYGLKKKMITESTEYDINWQSAFAIIGSSMYLTKPWELLMLLLTSSLYVYANATRKSRLVVRVLPHMLLFSLVFSYLFDKAKKGDDTRHLLEELYNSLDNLKITNVIFNFFCLALEICQFFLVNNGDSVNVMSMFDDYIENEINADKREKIEQIFTKNTITQECISTFNMCAHDLETRLDDQKQHVQDKCTHANIVVGYCRVISLRMLVLLCKHHNFSDAGHSNSGTLNYLRISHQKLDEFWRNHEQFHQDQLLISFKRQTSSTVSFCLEYFQNGHDETDYKTLKANIGSLWKLVSQPVKNTKLDEENNWHKMLKYVSSVMMLLYCRNKSLLFLFAKFGGGNVEIQQQAYRLLYNSYKAQALLEHDGTWYQFVTYISAGVDCAYFYYLLNYCWPESNASLSDQSSIVCKHERHLKTQTDEYQNAFINKMQQHIECAKRTRQRIAEIEHKNAFGPARAGAHSAHRPPAPSVRNETLPHEEQHLHGRTPADDDGAASSNSEGRADAADSGSSDESTGDDSDSGSDAPSRKPTKDIIMKLLCLRPEASVEQVNNKLKKILTSLKSDRTEKISHVLLALVKIFEWTSTDHNCNGASLDLCIQILTERVLNTFATLDIRHVHTCLTHIQTLKARCAKTDIFEQKIKALERALAQRLEQGSTCLFLKDSSQCVKTLEQLMQGV